MDWKLYWLYQKYIALPLHFNQIYTWEGKINMCRTREVVMAMAMVMVVAVVATYGVTRGGSDTTRRNSYDVAPKIFASRNFQEWISREIS